MIVFDINAAYSETTVAVVLEKTAVVKISESTQGCFRDGVQFK